MNPKYGSSKCESKPVEVVLHPVLTVFYLMVSLVHKQAFKLRGQHSHIPDSYTVDENPLFVGMLR